jgi:hypothetical protein
LLTRIKRTFVAVILPPILFMLADCFSGTFLVASSRWNSSAGVDAVLVRLSEVTDWEEGGRIEPHHVARIFAKDKAAGPYGKPVLLVYRQVH